MNEDRSVTPESIPEHPSALSETGSFVLGWGGEHEVLPDNPDSEITIHGTPVVAGTVYAPVVWAVRPAAPPATAPALAPEDRDAEYERYLAATKTVAERLNTRADATVGSASDVLKVTASFARDKGIRKEVKALVADGVPPVQALVRATAKFTDMFRLAGGLMAERVTDLKDVCDRVCAELLGEPEPGIPTPSAPSVLFADDLAPADTAGLDPALVVGLATELGGPTSHTAIIARQMGIPCIVAVRDLPSVKEGAQVLLDGTAGTITIGSDPDEARKKVDADAAWREKVRNWCGPVQTKDGHHVQLLVNVQDAAGAAKAAEGEAEGIGLLRTELCFLGESVEPSVETQKEIYKGVFSAYPGRKVVVRTLDAGSDKPVPFASLDDEENPALGVRGLRISGRDESLLLHQLDAIAAASAEVDGDHWVMAPMVSTIAEAEWFTGLVRERGLKGGIMVEVPAVAIMIDHFMNYVDFVSIGTNDLTQYVMAADRLSPHLAEYTDPWQPAVLHLIATTAEAGMRKEKPVGVCGEAAADPILACVLAGMGVSSLSMAASAVPYVGAQLSEVTLAQCRAAAKAVVTAKTPGEARWLARTALGIDPVQQ